VYIVLCSVCTLFSVVCHQLGFGDAVRAYSSNYFEGGGSLWPIWLDNVQCTSEDCSLSECSHSGWGNGDCSHSEDAGVACTGTGLLYENT